MNFLDEGGIAGLLTTRYPDIKNCQQPVDNVYV